MKAVYLACFVCIMSVSCMSYFQIRFQKKHILILGILILMSGLVYCDGFKDIYMTLMRIAGIYCMIRISKSRGLEILSIILLLETMMKSIYYLILLLIPLVMKINFTDLISYSHLVVQFMGLAIVCGILYVFKSSSYYIQVKCNDLTYLLLVSSSVISLYGLEVIPSLTIQLEEGQLYFLLLSFVYLVIINIVIYIYHSLQSQKEIEQKMLIEQTKIIQQEKDILLMHDRMIEDIEHDLRYFQSMVKGDVKDQLNKTIDDIENLHHQFIFKDDLLNHFIYIMKTNAKINNLHLQMIITNTNVSINISTYQSLISLYEYIIKVCESNIIQFSLKTVPSATVFEFNCQTKITEQPVEFMNEDNIIVQFDNDTMSCSLIIESEELL